MKVEFGVMCPDNEQMDESTIINKLINKLAIFLDRIDQDGNYITDRNSDNSHLAMAIKKCKWLLQNEYQDCKFNITYNGFLPIVGATVFVRQISGEIIKSEEIEPKLNKESAAIWHDPEYGIFNVEICKIRAKFIP